MLVLKLILALAIVIAVVILAARYHGQIQGDKAASGPGSDKKDDQAAAQLEEFIAAYRRDKAAGGTQQTAPTPQSAAPPSVLAAAAAAPPASGKARAAFLAGPSKLAFLLLKAGLPDHHVFANTRVSDLIDGPAAGPLNNLRIDLLVCRKDLAIVAAVDLPTAAQAETPLDREKEQRLRAAGIRYLRFAPGAFPKPAEVRGLIYRD
jgi:hypothetical protein